jgi:nicotinate dehydrogenase subunit B
MKKDNYLDLDFTDRLMDFQVSRREFIKIAGGGIFIFMTIGDIPIWAQQRRDRPSLPTDFNAFLQINEDGRVACFTGKIEMGQGIVTSLAQMLADELDVALDSVDMVMGDTDLCPWDMGTFGSMSTRFFGPPLRAAGAEGRQILLELAAEHLNRRTDQESDTAPGRPRKSNRPGQVRSGYSTTRNALRQDITSAFPRRKTDCS